jgi:hypothetical protein
MEDATVIPAALSHHEMEAGVKIDGVPEGRNGCDDAGASALQGTTSK